MSHPARMRTFGQKESDIPQVGPVEISNSREPKPREREPGAFSLLLDRLFLWIPREESPDFPALCLVASRMFLIPPAMSLPLIGLSAFSSKNAILAWVMSSIWSLRLVCAPLIHELCRYSFVRRADRPLRAASIFACACLLADMALSRSIAIGVTHILIELIASAAILFALNYKRHVPIVIAMLVLIGTTGNVIVSRFAPHKPIGPVSQDEPMDGNMRSWAKLYPGSIITLNRPQKILSMTQWQVSYDTSASPNRVAAFYSATASKEGFAPEATVFGINMFRNSQNGDRFSFSAAPTSHGSRVFFLAEYYGG